MGKILKFYFAALGSSEFKKKKKEQTYHINFSNSNKTPKKSNKTTAKKSIKWIFSWFWKKTVWYKKVAWGLPYVLDIVLFLISPYLLSLRSTNLWYGKHNVMPNVGLWFEIQIYLVPATIISWLTCEKILYTQESRLFIALTKYFKYFGENKKTCWYSLNY